MSTRRGLFGLFVGALAAPLVARNIQKESDGVWSIPVNASWDISDNSMSFVRGTDSDIITEWSNRSVTVRAIPHQ